MAHNRDLGSEVARLHAAAHVAGLALVCPHDSAAELHQSLVGEYLKAHPQNHPLAYAALLAARQIS
jgi:hypothetical protein